MTQAELVSKIDSIASSKKHSHLSQPNLVNTQTLFQSGYISTENTFLTQYANKSQIVKTGQFVKEKPSLDYAYVPLGIILEGEVVITKGNKATKTLYPGDFVGLFETSDWLLTGHKRNIGDWTLDAKPGTSILYFTEDFFNQENEVVASYKDYLIGLSRGDDVPQPITDLPLLDWVAAHTTSARLEDTVVIAHTHLLPNNFPFFRHLAHLVEFGRLFVLEKPYSTVRETFNKLVHSGVEIIQVRMEPGFPYAFAVQKSLELLWQQVIEVVKKEGIKNILIVDDGGDIWTSLPWHKLDGVHVAGVEQTQRGTSRIQGSNQKLPPIVSVATSGIKKLIESRFIGREVVRKLKSEGVLEKATTVGVLGMGTIGKSALTELEREDKKVYFYDPQSTEGDPRAQQSIDALLNESELVIGTTGTDVLKGVALERVTGKKLLASASSADVEFASVLKLAEPVSDPFSTISVQVHDQLELHVLNGGYPINFDREGNATPDKDIVLTRCLMYIGAMQAASLLTPNSKPGIYELDQVSQEKLLDMWLEERKDIEISENEKKEILSYIGLENAIKTPTIWQDF